MSTNPYSRWTPLRPHPVQNALWYSTKRFIVDASGRRSGKTELAKRKIVTVALTTETKFETNYYFCAAPTRAQAKKIYWNDIKALTRPWWSKQPSETELTVYTSLGDIQSEITVIGLDKPERIEGSPWNGGILDEYGNMKKGAFDENVYPALADREGWAWLIGVPEGRNHYYDKALYAAGGVLPKILPNTGGMVEIENSEWGYFHWFSSDILPAKMIESARDTLDERTYKQEYEGEFVSYGGQLYYAYSNDVIDDLIARRNINNDIILSCDFNKSPMAWVVGQTDEIHTARGTRTRLKIVDDVTVANNAKTQSSALLFIDKFKDQINKTVLITGDASNNFESHRDFTTDYMILKQTLEAHGWRVKVNVPTHNANINNRVNVANSLFEHKRCIINSKCTQLKLDLERNESDNKGGKDKSDPNQTHASDAFDYLVWLLFAREFKELGVAQ